MSDARGGLMSILGLLQIDQNCERESALNNVCTGHCRGRGIRLSCYLLELSCGVCFGFCSLPARSRAASSSIQAGL